MPAGRMTDRTAPARRPAARSRGIGSTRAQLNRTGSLGLHRGGRSGRLREDDVVEDWASAHRRLAWVSLDRRTTTPSLLVVSIIQALGPTSELEQLAMAPLVLAGAGFRRTSWCRGCARRSPPGRRAAIVLDDLHALRSRQAVEAVTALAQNLPEGAQLAIASRERAGDRAWAAAHPPARARTRHRGDRDERRPRRSGCSPHLGSPLGSEQVELLHARTEGWPVALYIAALRLDRAASRLIHGSFSGDDRFVADYVREEFLAGLGKLHAIS